MRLTSFALVVSAVFLIAAVTGCQPDATPATESAASFDNELVENRGADKDNWWDSLPRPEWQQLERMPIDDDWFEVYRVRDGVFAIYEPGQFEEVISFLVTGRERALLFDTGLGIGDIRSVTRALTELDVIVLNSHTHYDHIGGNYQFSNILGTDTEYTRRNEAGSTVDAVAEFVGPGWVWKPWPENSDSSTYRSMPFVVSDRVVDGQVIDLGGRVLEVLLTPGHAPDSLCLIDRANRLLFTGDTFYLAPLYAHLEGSDVAQYSATTQRLAGLSGEVDYLLTAHNVPLADSRYLRQLNDAFGEIQSGRGEYALTDGHREYDFGDFSVIVGDTVIADDQAN